MRDLTYRIVIRAFRLLFRALGLRIEVRGAHHLPARGPAIIASNHTGFLDFALIGYAAGRRRPFVRFLAKQSAFDHPVSGPAMRAMGHIPVDRSCGAVAARSAAQALAAGEVVGIFPEATISRSWMLKPFKPGAARLAVREQVPLIPAVVWGGHRVLTVDGRRTLRRGIPVTVLLGAPVPLRGGDAVEVGRTLRQRMQALLEEAVAGYPDQPRDDADRWWLPQHVGGTAPTPEAAAVLDAAAVARVEARSSRATASVLSIPLPGIRRGGRARTRRDPRW